MANIDLTDIEQDITDTPFTYFHRLGGIYIGSCLSSKEHVAYLKNQDFKVAIDLKTKGESLFPEQSELETVGIDYFNFPVSDLLSISFDFLSHLKETLDKYEGKKLVYCMSGNRVGAILAMMESLVSGQPKERTFEVAQKIGMTKEPLKQQLARVFELN